ncbi:integrase core domain-containing protein [Nesterenkonia alkaliphila]|uniref:integrase core domain-containing protein n=1 Tax=Nesterenkonia alkaliphila TaxID=1463631 RepID=UPI00403A6124
MKKNNEPIDARIRLAIAQWPDDAPRGSVTAFCAEHGISRKSFYAIRSRARNEGQTAALEPRSRRPKTSPKKITDDLQEQALGVRTALESSGLDHGPISVYDKMASMGISPPSVASLARIFRQHNVARAEPKKRPRAAYRRFVYPAPNACWQLDATEYVLTGGRKCVIFQLEDDHSRKAVASHVAEGETAEAAITVFTKGVAACGVPQRLLTDNGSALNTSRRGWEAKLTAYVITLGVEAITGKPGKPTTQGKNERFHQTLFRYLDKQPLATTCAQLQDQVDEFDRIYNTERGHQGLPGRMTPQQAWEATPVAEPPRPASEPVEPVAPDPHVPDQAPGPAAATPSSDLDLSTLWEKAVSSSSASSQSIPAPEKITGSIHTLAATGHQHIRVYANGVVSFAGTLFSLSRVVANRIIIADWDPERIIFATTIGEVIAEFAWPPPGTKYQGITKARYRFQNKS